MRNRWLRALLEFPALALAYAATARVGFLIAFDPGNVTVVWPPSGIALAMLLLVGNRAAFGVWAGSLVANLWFFSRGAPLSRTQLVVAAAIATGSALQGLLAARL